MLLLGLLLLAATGAFTGLVIADNLDTTRSITVTVLGNQIAVLSPLAVFCAGLALAIIFFLGLAMVLGGGRLRARRRAALAAEPRRADAAPGRPVAPGAADYRADPMADPMADPVAGRPADPASRYRQDTGADYPRSVMEPAEPAAETRSAARAARPGDVDTDTAQPLPGEGTRRRHGRPWTSWHRPAHR